MTDRTIRSMEEEADWSGCTGGKVRGGIILGKTNFGLGGQLLDLTTGNVRFWTCVCGSDMLVPVPASVIKAAAKGLLGKQAFGWIASFIKARGSAFRNLLRPKTLQKMQESLDKADEAVRAYRQNLVNKIRPKYQSLLEQRDQIIQAIEASGNGQAYKAWRRYEQYAKAIRRGEMLGPNGKMVKLSPEQIEKYKRLAREQIDLIPPPLGQQFRDVVKNLIPLRMAEEKGIELLDNAANIRQAKSKVERAFTDPLANFDEALNNTPDGLKDLILSALLHGLFALLDATTIIMEKNCLDYVTGLPDGMMGAGLDQSTCRCTVCPPRYPDLCDVSSWVADFLPSLPGSRQSDEFNVCIECCDNAVPKARWFTGGSIGDIAKEFGVPPCTCECPTEIDGGPTKKLKCKDPNACPGSGTSKWACKTVNPPDDPDGSISAASGGSFVSKYRYDVPTCKWVCKVPCASGCCEASENCVNGECLSCPPGHTTINSPTGMLGIQQTECVENCLADPSICGTDCCEFSYLASTPSGPAPIGVCLPCPDKTRALRFDDQYAESAMNPWRSRVASETVADLFEKVASTKSFSASEAKPKNLMCPEGGCTEIDMGDFGDLDSCRKSCEDKYVCEYTYDLRTKAISWDCNWSPDAGIMYPGMTYARCQEETLNAAAGRPSACSGPDV